MPATLTIEHFYSLPMFFIWNLRWELDTRTLRMVYNRSTLMIWEGEGTKARTAAENYAALVDFFNLYPEYQTRPFYTTGESYAGVYIPTLSALLIKGIQSGALNINYKV
ncbi:hypothetical protein COOONC_25793 [Cooperia oncophora]